MSNKVRLYEVSSEGESGPRLYVRSPTLASIRDETATLRSRMYLATMRADHAGWVLSINGRDDTHGPFATAEDGYEWYMAHRDNVPPGRRPPRRHTDWPPGSPWDVDDE